MLAPLQPVRDLRLSGQVIHVGRSSMEVVVRMEALNKDAEDETIMLGTPLRQVTPFAHRFLQVDSVWSVVTVTRTKLHPSTHC